MDEIKVNHNNLPEAVGVIYKELVNTKNELSEVKRLFAEVSEKLENYSYAPVVEDPDKLFTIKEAAEFLRVKENAIHVWKREGKIPYIMAGGSKPLFRKEDLLNYNRIEIKKPKGLERRR